MGTSLGAGLTHVCVRQGNGERTEDVMDEADWKSDTAKEELEEAMDEADWYPEEWPACEVEEEDDSGRWLRPWLWSDCDRGVQARGGAGSLVEEVVRLSSSPLKSCRERG